MADISWSKTFNMDRKKLDIPTLSIINGTPFLFGWQLWFHLPPLCVSASVTQARLLSQHQWLVCGSTLHFHHPSLHTHINKHRFSAGSPWWTDLATVRCYGRVSPHSHIQNASVFPSVPAFTAEWQNRGHARWHNDTFFFQTRKTTERIIQTRKPFFNDFFSSFQYVIGLQ